MLHRREVRRLLNLIDHLPRNSHYAEATANDEEYTKLLVDSGLLDGPPQEYRPPMSTWSPEVAMLADLIDAVNGLRGTLIQVNSKGGKQPEIKPYPRPGTMLEKVRREQRRRKHDEIVAMVEAARAREGQREEDG